MLTEQERTEIVELADATRKLFSVYESVELALESTLTDLPGPTLVDALSDIKDAWFYTDHGMLARLSIVPNGGTLEQDIYPWRALTLAEKAAVAFSALDQGLSFMTEADTNITSAQSLELGNEAYQLNLATAKALLGQARALSEGFDRSLLFAEPFPASWPKMFGPHGEYDRASFFIGESRYYMRVSFGRAISAWKQLTNLTTAERKAYFFSHRKYGLGILDVLVEATLRMSEVDLSIPDLATRSLYTINELLGKNGSDYWNALRGDRGYLMERVYHENQHSKGILIAWNDSWSKMDRGTWAMLDLEIQFP